MADYGYGVGYGTGLAHGITHGSDQLAKGIIAAHVQAKKQHQDAEGVQALLDIAHRFQIPDPKTGKPVPILKEEHYQYIKGLIDNKKYHAAGQAEAAFGITKDMIPRWQAAAAKQAAAYQKQQQIAAQSAQGPVESVDSRGVPMILDPNTGKWTYNPGKPQNVQGLNANEQVLRDQAQQRMVQEHTKNLNASQMAQFNAQKAATEALRKGFDAQLNQLGIKSQLDLFNPSIQQGGMYSPQTGFVAPKAPSADQPSPMLPNAQGKMQSSMAYYQQMMANPNAAPTADITHVMFYSDPTGKKGSKDSPDQPVPAVLPVPDLIQAQNTAAALAGPNTLAALQWLRQNPDSEHATKVRQQLMEDLNKEPTPPEPHYAPDIVQPKPEVMGPSAPRALNLPPGQPFTTGAGTPDTGDQSQVSDEAADQNPGY